MHLSELFNCSNEQFVLNCYHLMLGREPDEEGYLHHINMLQAGRSRLRIVRGIARSSEARRRGVRLQGLRGALLWDWLARKSGVGPWLRRIAWARGVDETLKRVWVLEERCGQLLELAAEDAAIAKQRGRRPQVEMDEAARWLSPRGLEIFEELRG